MEGVIYVALFLISIAFAIVVGYISFVLYRITTMLKTVDKSVGELEQEVTGLIPPLRESIQETDKLVDDIDVKAQSMDHLVTTAENLGQSVNDLNATLSNTTAKLSDEELQKKTKVFTEGLQWSEVAFKLYSRWNKSSKNELMKQKQPTDITPIKQTGEGNKHVIRNWYFTYWISFFNLGCFSGPRIEQPCARAAWCRKDGRKIADSA
ncbi:UPF0478 protein YtxG [Lentibacillus sp. JNUCC-1]|uniref:DUF948 domain-containing protein n=1 Tax=Lentibacillus sp. JNUCC-1 TaxID=2654513 RepID=UPI0012E7818E|nr:DUF948 domain-containing protein [Lentibacillus sp. JNUCC-1]MUV38860.1 UPF0478 protein YtxG [Lentibacillus sp. JNUCC-1]